jgi:hypothetical protein
MPNRHRGECIGERQNGIRQWHTPALTLIQSTYTDYRSTPSPAIRTDRKYVGSTICKPFQFDQLFLRWARQIGLVLDSNEKDNFTVRLV